MKILNIASLILSISTLCFVSCNSHKKIAFNENELKWLAPFNSIDTTIYQSENNLIDTIIFYPQESSKSSVSDFERGFYSTYSNSVKYRLTGSSYHKFVQINGGNESKFLISMGKDDIPTSTSMEFYFLGLLFNQTYLDKLKNDTGQVVNFDEADAAYKELNIVEGIKSFEFDFKKGIISFVDKNDIHWKIKSK